MASTTSLEGVKKAVFFPFQGKNWGVKMLIGSLIGLASFIIPIVPSILLLGYYGGTMKKVILQDEDPELPEWNDWGTFFLDGLKLFGAYLLYMLPALLVTVGGYLLFFALDIGLMVSSAQYQYGSSPSTLPYSIFGTMIGMFVGIVVAMVGILLMFATMVFLPPALGNMIAKNDFNAAFRIKEWWPVFKANLSGFILAIAIMLGMYMILLMAVYILYFTIVLCFLLPFVICIIAFLLGAMGFSLFAVAYRDGSRLAKIHHTGDVQASSQV